MLSSASDTVMVNLPSVSLSSGIFPSSSAGLYVTVVPSSSVVVTVGVRPVR